MKTSLRIILSIIIHILIALIILGYAFIACSVTENNLFFVSYEPSGLQMLYYALAFPVLVGLSLCLYLLKYLLNEEKNYASFPFITGLVFFLFITAIDRIITFPKGITVFYYGGLLLSLVFFILNLVILKKTLE